MRVRAARPRAAGSRLWAGQGDRPSSAPSRSSRRAPGDDPKRTSAGAAARLALVAEHFPDARRHLAARTWSRSEVARDDLLDAYAVLWTALRVARGPGHHRELGDGARDACGLRQRILV